jgi:acyl carrier protein
MIQMIDQLTSHISRVLNISETKVNSDSTAASIEEWDSLSHINLIFSIEQKFGVRFTDEQVIDSMSVIKLFDIISSKDQ